MRVSQFPLTTLKETPADAEVISHRLMLRSAMIRRVATGVYTWMPLGMRVLRRIEQIVREEMNRAGALEILMPAVQPSELWEESGRWQNFGPELLRFADRHGRDFCIGPTHEEIVTDLVRNDIRSYRQLPLNLYQIQIKFRDEIRPRFGVMRSREFIMKDAYSFDCDAAAMERSYEVMRDAYNRIFNRIGLDFRMVIADSGAIGGGISHEFHVLADSGEDAIVFSDGSDYAANIEMAEAGPLAADRPQPTAPMSEIETPDQRTIAALSEFLQLPPQHSMKTLLVAGADGQPVVICLRGDHELNLIKAQKHPAVAQPLRFLNGDELLQATGADAGSIGPVGLQLQIIADKEAALMADFVCGANRNGYHYVGVNWGRDLEEPTLADLRNIGAGDPSPDGHGQLGITRGIEVGHIFQLGDEYSRSMNATVLAEDGKPVHPMMGCYGIGVTRIAAAAIEQNHDDRGIIWPASIAPFEIALLGLNLGRSERLRSAVDALYAELSDVGFEVLLDDRNVRPGVMFADMELIGIPHRLVMSERGLDNNEIEYKGRTDSDKTVVPSEQIVAFLNERMRGAQPTGTSR